jgi:hypothetical protein
MITLDSLLISQRDASNRLCEGADGLTGLLGSEGTAHGIIIDLHRIARVRRDLFDEAAEDVSCMTRLAVGLCLLIEFMKHPDTSTCLWV